MSKKKKNLHAASVVCEKIRYLLYGIAIKLHYCWLYLTIDNLDLTTGNKTPNSSTTDYKLHVIEELEAVAKFSELRENQRLNM